MGEHAPIRRDAQRFAAGTLYRGAKSRVSGDGRGRVARQVDFRDDLHMAGGRKAHDVADFVLSVEAAVARAARFDPPGTDGGQARILANLDPPTLIVGQMPVQYIELVPGHPVDHGANEGGRLKMPRGVEHQAAPSVLRRIANALHRDAAGIGARRQQLPESDGAVEQTRRGAGGDRDPLRRHFEFVGFRSESLGAAELNRVGVCVDAAGRSEWVTTGKVLPLVRAHRSAR